VFYDWVTSKTTLNYILKKKRVGAFWTKEKMPENYRGAFHEKRHGNI